MVSPEKQVPKNQHPLPCLGRGQTAQLIFLGPLLQHTEAVGDKVAQPIHQAITSHNRLIQNLWYIQTDCTGHRLIHQALTCHQVAQLIQQAVTVIRVTCNKVV